MSCKCKDNYDANKRHEEICKSIHEDIYIPKNEAYGDSFHKLYEDLGIISAVTQITHKYNRLKNLAKEMNEGKVNQNDESIKDTLIDLANYCILTYMEMERAEIECQCKEEDKK